MSLLKKPNELDQKTTFSALFYGQPGIGKTTLALSAPKPVIIDADGGLYRVEKRYQCDSLQMAAYDEVLQLLQGNELAEYKTIVIDTLGKLIDRIGDYVAVQNPKMRQANGVLTMQGWGQVKLHFGQLVKLIQGKGKSVIFVAHESEEKDGDATKKRPDVSGSARKDIVKELDLMGYMSANGGKRTISFDPSDAFYAKNSIGLNGVIEVPNIDRGNTFVQDKIIAAMIARQNADAELLKEYDVLKSHIESEIAACKTIIDFNEKKNWLAGLKHLWDTKFYGWTALTDAAKKAGFAYDKDFGAFVADKGVDNV